MERPKGGLATRRPGHAKAVAGTCRGSQIGCEGVVPIAHNRGHEGDRRARECRQHLRKPVMKAVLCTRPGAPEDLTIADLPDPLPGPGEAVVRIAAAALNFFDLLIIAGKYQYKPPYPFSPGAEFAGTVESVGQDVTEFAVGDRVMGYSGWGAAREKLAIKTGKLSKISAALDFERAAGLGVTYGTSYYGLKNRGG